MTTTAQSHLPSPPQRPATGQPHRAPRPWALLGALLLGGCATRPDPILTTGGYMPNDLMAAMRCPRDTSVVIGRTQGIESAAWCERASTAPGTGVKHGPYVDWFDSRAKKSAGLYQEGLRQGTWRFWLQNGAIDSEITYEHGQVVSQLNAATLPLGVQSTLLVSPPPAAAPAPAPAPAPGFAVAGGVPVCARSFEQAPSTTAPAAAIEAARKCLRSIPVMSCVLSVAPP